MLLVEYPHISKLLPLVVFCLNIDRLDVLFEIILQSLCHLHLLNPLALDVDFVLLISRINNILVYIQAFRMDFVAFLFKVVRSE